MKGSIVRTVCPLCDGGDHAFVMSSADQIIGRGERFSVVRCRRCGHVFTNPRPDAAMMREYYRPQYWAVSSAKPDLATLALGGIPWRTVMRRRAGPILKHIRRGRMVEIGCGDGLFLHYMQKQGWEVVGVEPGESASAYARETLGLDVRTESVGRCKLEASAYDLVYFHHVLEHVDRPVEAMARAARWLRPAGYACVVVPNYGGFDRRVFGEHWRGLGVPVHIQHFTEGTLRALFERVGLEVVGVDYLSCEGLWPCNYSDSLRTWLRSGRKAETAPGAAPGGGVAGVPSGEGNALASGKGWLDALHAMEYRFFRLWGRGMDVLGMGSSILVIGRRRPAAKV